VETKLVRIGDEYALVFDDLLIELLQITPETQMEITVQGDAIVLTPIRKPTESGDMQPE
jgi:antitoxin component of MazEF toxin-antitoxin module